MPDIQAKSDWLVCCGPCWLSGYGGWFHYCPLSLDHLTAGAGVGLSPIQVTCGTSQVLLAGVSGVFFQGNSHFCPTYWLACLDMSEIILKGTLNLIKKKRIVCFHYSVVKTGGVIDKISCFPLVSWKKRRRSYRGCWPMRRVLDSYRRKSMKNNRDFNSTCMRSHRKHHQRRWMIVPTYMLCFQYLISTMNLWFFTGQW